MKKIQLIISIFFIVLLVGCASIRSNESISLDKIQGRKTLIINYDRNHYSAVKIDNIVISSGVPYYVEAGNYTLSYIETAFLNGYIDMSWKSEKGVGGNGERKFPQKKFISVTEDTEITLENHLVQINVLGNFNSDKNF